MPVSWIEIAQLARLAIHNKRHTHPDLARNLEIASDALDQLYALCQASDAGLAPPKPRPPLPCPPQQLCGCPEPALKRKLYLQLGPPQLIPIGKPSKPRP
jgi:hypothetical protein